MAIAGVAATVYLAPGVGGTAGQCAFGPGPAAIKFVAACPLVDLDLTEIRPDGKTTSSTDLAFTTTVGSATLLVRSGFTYDISVGDVTLSGVSGDDLIAAGSVRYFKPTDSATCILAIDQEKTGTPAPLTIKNECKAPVTVIIHEVADGYVLTSLIETIPGLSVVYQASTDTPLVQVCVGGRCATSPVLPGPAPPIVISNRTGFCAPALSPIMCPC